MKKIEKMLSIAAIAFLLVTLLPVPGYSGDESAALKVITKSWDIVKGGTLNLSTCGGSIKAMGTTGDKLNVKILIEKYKPEVANALAIIEKNIEIGKDGNDVTVKVDCEKIRENFKYVTVAYIADIPKGYNVKANTGGGSVKVSGLDSNCKVNTGGGSVDISDINGEKIEVNTGGGSVDVKGISSGKVDVNTGGGSIEVSNTAKAVNLHANTGGGSISVESLKGESKLNTGGGSIEVKETDGTLKANTGGGSISVDAAKGITGVNTGGGSIDVKKIEGTLSAHTGGGSVKAEVIKLTKEDSINLGTGGGDVHLYISGNLPVTFDLKIEDNDHNTIKSDFPLKIEGDRKDDEIIGTGEINGGGAVVKIRTSSSDIYIHKI